MAAWPDRSGWDEALAAHFFAPAEAERNVYFCVDDDALIEIARRRGWQPAGEAPERFLRALRVYVSPAASDHFLSDLVRGRVWLTNGSARAGAPPFLSVLGVTVLAAARSGTLNKRGSFYHATLRRLLGLSEGQGAVPGYERVPAIWTLLANWLAAEGFTRGKPTAWAPAKYWQNIGFAMSQALLRGAERENLVDFFQSAGLQPGSDVPPKEMELRLREWARASAAASDRLRELLDDPELAPHVGEIASSRLRRWDGAARDAQGYRLAGIVPTVDLRRKRLGLAIRVAEGVPAVAINIGGEVVRVTPDRRWAPLTRTPSREDLLDGLGGAAGEVRAALRGSPAHVLLPDELLGAYAGGGRPEVGRTVMLLVHRSAGEDAELLFRTTDQQPKAVKTVPLPEGWSLWRDVVVPRAEVILPERLRALAPPRGQVPTLSGGLRLNPSRAMFLMGGAPDVDVPGIAERQQVFVDGTKVQEVGRAGGRVSLESLKLPGGEHEVEVGSTKLRFTLLPRLVETAAEPVLAHRLARVDNGWAARGPASAVDPAADLLLSGASLSGRRLAEVPASARPRMIKARATWYLAVACRCKAKKLEVDPLPWLRRAELEQTAFELEDAVVRSSIDFEPALVVRVMTRSAQVVGLARPRPHACRRADEWLARIDALNVSFAGGDWVQGAWGQLLAGAGDA